MENSCRICLDDLESKVKATPDVCDHVFCLPCLERWSKTGYYCPVDRKRYTWIIDLESGTKIQVKRNKRRKTRVLYDFTTLCEVCGTDKSPSSMLLCDSCDLGYHCFCLKPPLKTIPSGFWSCPDCVRVEQSLRNRSGFSKEVEADAGPEFFRKQHKKTRLDQAESSSSSSETVTQNVSIGVVASCSANNSSCSVSVNKDVSSDQVLEVNIREPNHNGDQETKPSTYHFPSKEPRPPKAFKSFTCPKISQPSSSEKTSNPDGASETNYLPLKSCLRSCEPAKDIVTIPVSPSSVSRTSCIIGQKNNSMSSERTFMLGSEDCSQTSKFEMKDNSQDISSNIIGLSGANNVITPSSNGSHDSFCEDAINCSSRKPFTVCNSKYSKKSSCIDSLETIASSSGSLPCSSFPFTKCFTQNLKPKTSSPEKTKLAHEKKRFLYLRRLERRKRSLYRDLSRVFVQKIQTSNSSCHM